MNNIIFCSEAALLPESSFRRLFVMLYFIILIMLSNSNSATNYISQNDHKVKSALLLNLFSQNFTKVRCFAGLFNALYLIENGMLFFFFFNVVASNISESLYSSHRGEMCICYSKKRAKDSVIITKKHA